ncbi:alpha-1,3/alpha-1,6-mannosyltransferase [Geosmithia morbida]|uniref:Alpha-1,3/1,6-mannosyltransferase ALG2 n=1 Tax=Geosmithia morbida TaxID=1094350 RepID=A0A9P4YM61_9HYPO|nr:alpha-1,3/alpha-1,6-mannosyltransferase [Geosmithia morbida]KAF4119528.1 alpha-1,3/alpha-1,6-mannosyltransferase [Geosmithia morbida]
MARKSASSKAKPPPSDSDSQNSTDVATQQQGKDKPRGTIVFFHPDLGIGGAERLVVDAAVGLQERGFRVVIFTNHCDPSHCFDECRDGTLDVRVRAAGPVPMSILNRFTILCAILRHLQLLITIAITGELYSLRPDAFIADQLSAGLPLLANLYPAAPILFYCHFPDLHLALGRDASLIKRLYRRPFDTLERWSMGYSTSIAVNSDFTRRVVNGTWPGLEDQKPMRVVYPCVDTRAKAAASEDDEGDSEPVLDGDKIILSINRFEGKKDIGLAIKAFAAIPTDKREGARLVLAGGYDARIGENVRVLSELRSLADSLSLGHATVSSSDSLSSAPLTSEAPVLFLPSVSSASKAAILEASRLLVYTPAAEHFGIVPIEAMLARVPVLAATTGGPVESVQDGITGWLRSTLDTPAWTDVMTRALSLSKKERKKMGDAGARRVEELFSRDGMARRFEAILAEMLAQPRVPVESTFFGRVIELGAMVVIMAVAFGFGLLIAHFYYPVRHSVNNMLGFTKKKDT